MSEGRSVESIPIESHTLLGSGCRTALQVSQVSIVLLGEKFRNYVRALKMQDSAERKIWNYNLLHTLQEPAVSHDFGYGTVRLDLQTIAGPRP